MARNFRIQNSGKSLASSKKTLNNQKSRANLTKKGKNVAAGGRGGNLKGSFGAAKQNQNLASNQHQRQTLKSANKQSAKVSRKSNLNTVQNNSHSQRRNPAITNKVKKSPLIVPKSNSFASQNKDSKMKKATTSPTSSNSRKVLAVNNNKALKKNAKGTKVHSRFSKPAQVGFQSKDSKMKTTAAAGVTSATKVSGKNSSNVPRSVHFGFSNPADIEGALRKEVKSNKSLAKQQKRTILKNIPQLSSQIRNAISSDKGQKSVFNTLLKKA